MRLQIYDGWHCQTSRGCLAHKMEMHERIITVFIRHAMAHIQCPSTFRSCPILTYRVILAGTSKGTIIAQYHNSFALNLIP